MACQSKTGALLIAGGLLASRAAIRSYEAEEESRPAQRHLTAIVEFR